MDCAAVSSFLVEKLKVFLQKTGLKGFTVGISGGIDSAVVSTLCAETGLPTLCVTLPIHQAPDQVARGEEHLQWLKSYSNVTLVNVDLTDAFDMFMLSFPQEVQDNEWASVNARARLRMTALYSFGNIVVGTGNKIEDFGCGFFTKHGDGGVDVSPIGDCLKTEIYELAAFLDICNSIRIAKPTDGLWKDNRTDEDQLGASYPELQEAMNYCEGLPACHSSDVAAIKKEAGNNDLLTHRQKEVIDIYLKWHTAGEHKMKMPEIFYIPLTLKK